MARFLFRLTPLPALVLVLMFVLGVAAAAASGSTQEREQVELHEDFSRDGLAAGLRLTNPSWRPEGGELRGRGAGRLILAMPLAGDLALSFTGWTADKANVEVKLVDPEDGAELFTYAFLGRFHGVLDGARACMLQGDHFVAVEKSMWIYPGRRFTFEVHRDGPDYRMVLDGALGPTFHDEEAGAAPFRLEIVVDPEGGGALVLDDIKLRGRAAPAAGPSRQRKPRAAAEEPPGEPPVFAVLELEHLTIVNHADPSLELPPIGRELERMHAFLADYVGVAPERIIVHVGNDYRFGHARTGGKHPEMFLRAERIFDSTVDHAHEMAHCFTFRFGQPGGIPHWFFESLADLAYADAEIELFQRRKEAEFLATFDRADHRSFELMQLRIRHGREFGRRLLEALEARRAECLETLRPDVPLEQRNLLLLEAIDAATDGAGARLLREKLDFDPRTRERQRGY